MSLRPNITNQVLAGVNYFNQVFNDENTAFDMASLGLVDGSSLPGAANIKITGFDPTGETPPEGRNDITGHLTDDLSWVIGKHQIKLGGELRKAQLDEFYHRHALGIFTFDGSQGPDAANPNDSWDAGDPRVDALADFLSGRISNASIALGDPDRQVFVNTWDLFAEDAWQATAKFNVNFGLRWDYEGPLHNSYKNLSVFRPSLGGTGIAIQGDADIESVTIPSIPTSARASASPIRLRPNTVVRAGAGLYYDTPNLNPFLDNRPGNGAPNGVEGNPTGPGISAYHDRERRYDSGRSRCLQLRNRAFSEQSFLGGAELRTLAQHELQLPVGTELDAESCGAAWLCRKRRPSPAFYPRH